MLKKLFGLNPAPAPVTPAAVSLSAEKRTIVVERLRASVAKLEARLVGAPGDPKAGAWRAKVGELKAELLALELEDRAARIRAGDVTVQPGPAALGLKGEG